MFFVTKANVLEHFFIAYPLLSKTDDTTAHMTRTGYTTRCNCLVLLTRTFYWQVLRTSINFVSSKSIKWKILYGLADKALNRTATFFDYVGFGRYLMTAPEFITALISSFPVHGTTSLPPAVSSHQLIFLDILRPIRI